MNDPPTSKYGDAMQQNAIPVMANVTGIMRIFNILISFLFYSLQDNKYYCVCKWQIENLKLVTRNESSSFQILNHLRYNHVSLYYGNAVANFQSQVFHQGNITQAGALDCGTI